MSPLSAQVAREKFCERCKNFPHAPSKKTYVRTFADGACEAFKPSPNNDAIVRHAARTPFRSCGTLFSDTRPRRAKFQKKLSSESLIVCRFSIRQRRCQSLTAMCNDVILIRLIRATVREVSDLHGTARRGM